MITVDRLPHLTPAELANPTSKLGVPDFCDWRVFAVPSSYRDINIALVYGPDNFDVCQSHDGPSYIVVGADVTDERLARHLPTLSERYGAGLGQLQAARAGEVVTVRIERPAGWVESRVCLGAAEVL